MPACFQLTKKGDNKPMNLVKVDEFICEQLGVLPDPVKWYACWHDLIGLGIACGNELGSDKLRKAFSEPPLSDVLKVLEDHFISDAWHER